MGMSDQSSVPLSCRAEPVTQPALPAAGDQQGFADRIFRLQDRTEAIANPGETLVLPPVGDLRLQPIRVKAPGTQPFAPFRPEIQPAHGRLEVVKSLY